MKILLLFPMLEEVQLAIKDITYDGLLEKGESNGFFACIPPKENLQIKTAVCGIGKVNVVYEAAIRLATENYDLVVLCGTAGGFHGKVNQFDVVVGVNYLQHDYGLNENKGLTPFPPGGVPIGTPEDPVLRPLTVPFSFQQDASFKTVFGDIASGDQFMANDLDYTMLSAQGISAIDMESAALAQMLIKHNAKHAWRDPVPMVVIRGITDMAGEGAVTDFQAALTQAASNACKVLNQLLNEYM